MPLVIDPISLRANHTQTFCKAKHVTSFIPKKMGTDPADEIDTAQLHTVRSIGHVIFPMLIISFMWRQYGNEYMYAHMKTKCSMIILGRFKAHIGHVSDYLPCVV